MNFIQNYLEKIKTELNTGRAREHSYRPAMKDLLQNINAEILATNEPAREKCGAPDFVITDKNNVPRGYIEAKDITTGILDKPENQKQIKKYFDGELGYNFIHTDNLEFRFYRDGEKVETVIIGKLENGRIQELPENFAKLEQLLNNFLTFHGQTINSSKKLSKLMAGKARMIRDMILGALEESENCTSELRGQYETFRKVLMHDMQVKDFADVYAQTITYGLFAARLHDPTLPTFDRDEAARLLPKSNPFLRKFFQTLRDDIDPRIEWIVDDLIEVFRACDVRKILNKYGKSTRRNDPVVHFYEDFLADYDPKLRKARGVWYTPEPVVDFIVRGVDEILKTEFGLEEGLADKSKIEIEIETQGKVHGNKKDKKNIIKKQIHRVQVLDPATGTGTFLAQVIKQVHSHYENMPALWSEYVKKDLIPRIHGFEILMASYSMAHMKLDLLLKELGHQSEGEERLGVYLTNSLEEAHPDSDTLFSSWLSEEANAANCIKQNTPVMCVIGNPPYAVSSSNKGKWIENLLKDYKKDLKEKSYNALSDDYVKFLRYSQHYIEKNGQGVVAMITNNSFLDGIVHRQMRKYMMQTYDKIYVIDLHGNAKKKEVCPNGSKDDNVFDIMQGVSICFFVKTTNSKKLAKIYHEDVWGKRKAKYKKLEDNTLKSLKTIKLKNKEPYYFFVPKDFEAEEKYNEGFKVDELFENFSSGIQTERDNLVIKNNIQELKEIIKKILELDEEDFRAQYTPKKDGRDWKIATAKKDISHSDYKIKDINYRPFDIKKTIYTGRSKGIMAYPRHKIMKHFIGKKNLGFCLMRSTVNTSKFETVFLSNSIIDKNFYGFQTHFFPLYLYEEDEDNLFDEKKQNRTPNFNPEILKKIEEKLKLKLETDFTPEDLFDYIYAVLHSPKYRETYKEFLKIDFPRIPYPKNQENFWKLVKLGKQIRELHLLESPLLSASKNIRFDGGTDLTVGKPKYEFENKRVYINDSVYFEGVDEIAWNFYIGGYQPAQKWLKDRKGRKLSVDDVKHYTQMMVSMSETNRLMKEVDLIMEF